MVFIKWNMSLKIYQVIVIILIVIILRTFIIIIKTSLNYLFSNMKRF